MPPRRNRRYRTPTPPPRGNRGGRRYTPPGVPSPTPPNLPGSGWRNWWDDVAPIGPQRDPDSPWGWGPGAPPGEATPPTEEPGPGDPPPYDPPEGYEWVWDPETEDWVIQETEEEEFDNDLFEEWRAALAQFGFEGTEVDEFLAQGLREGWSTGTRVIKMRQQSWYLANPLFAANLQRSREGKRFLSEQEVLNYAADVRSLVRQFGYTDVPDSYIALSLTSKANDPNQMLAQMNHQLSVQQRVNLMGGGVRMVYEEVLGRPASDQDLYELFDPTIDTDDIDRALRQAEYRGRPLTLGLGIRSETEARAFEMLGISPEEAFSRYQQVAQNAPRIAHFAAIEELLNQGLPDDWSPDFSTAENSTLNKAFLLAGTVEGAQAFAQIQQLYAREAARARQSGSAVATGQGQQLGLLNTAEMQTYG